MEISGKVWAILASQSGEGSKGPWIKHSFVIETEGQYPKKVMFSQFSQDPNARLTFDEGDNVTVSFSVESREYNNKWYSDIKAYKVVTESHRSDHNKSKQQTKTPLPTGDDDFFSPINKTSTSSSVDTNTDDLPF